MEMGCHGRRQPCQRARSLGLREHGWGVRMCHSNPPCSPTTRRGLAPEPPRPPASGPCPGEDLAGHPCAGHLHRDQTQRWPDLSVAPGRQTLGRGSKGQPRLFPQGRVRAWFSKEKMVKKTLQTQIPTRGDKGSLQRDRLCSLVTEHGLPSVQRAPPPDGLCAAVRGTCMKSPVRGRWVPGQTTEHE